MKSRLLGAVCACVTNFFCMTSVSAGIVAEYSDFSTYATAVGSYSTIDFDDGYSHGTVISNQYIGQGVTFTDVDDAIFLSAPTFPTDGVGLDGNGSIDITFSAPISHMAIDFSSVVTMSIYIGGVDGALIDISNEFGSAGTGFFAGIVSDMPFDRVIISDTVDGESAIDNLYFNTPVPIPAAVWLFSSGLLGLIGVARRKVRA